MPDRVFTGADDTLEMAEALHRLRSPVPASRGSGLAAWLATLAALAGMACSDSPGMPATPGGALGLARYTTGGVFPLAVREASAVVWHPDRDSLLVMGDPGTSIVEVDRMGRILGSMSLEDFRDTEGLAHAGGARLFVAEEAGNDVVVVEYVPGARAHRPSLESWDVAPPSGNQGLEGLSFDPRSGRLLATKERAPQAIYEIELFEAPRAQIRPLFDAEQLPVRDLAGIQVLSTVSKLADGPAAGHLLVLSQESSRLLEIDRDGRVLDALSLRFFSEDAEGVTVDAAGRIYVVGESSRRTGGSALLVLEPPSETAPDAP